MRSRVSRPPPAMDTVEAEFENKVKADGKVTAAGSARRRAYSEWYNSWRSESRIREVENLLVLGELPGSSTRQHPLCRLDLHPLNAVDARWSG